MSAELFDRQLERLRQMRALALGPATFLLERVAADLAERLGAVTRSFDLAADLGTPAGALRDVLARNPRIGKVIAVHPLATRPGNDGLGVAADIEALPFREGSLDLVVSALALQSANDLPGVLVQARRALRPDGLFLAAMLGGETLTELRQAFAQAEEETVGGVSPRVAPFADVRTAGMLLQRAGFALPVSDLDRIVVRYPSTVALLGDLRRMGATNALRERRRIPLRRTTLLALAHHYAQRFSDPDGKIRATFDVVWLSGWAPHASQQQPLRPGSASARLADALRVTEMPAGEKAGE